MKKVTFIACAATLLASTFAFTGCKSETTDPESAPKVTTDIAISLPGQLGNRGARRMPGQTVQQNGQTDFSANGGMEQMVLIPFANEKATASSKRYGNNIDLGEFTAANSQSLSDNADGRAKVYTEKQVPMGTSAFLFYGKSKASGNGFQVGSLAGTMTGDPGSYHFDLGVIAGNTSSISADAALFDAYLNGVANAHDTLYNGAAWKNISASDNQGYHDMFEAYKGLNTLTTFGVERMMTDLYHSLDVNVDSLAKAIRKAILDPQYASLQNDKVVLVSAMQNFPQKYDIPTGAVAVAYDNGTAAFGDNSAQSYGGLAPADLNRYVYPAQLWYFANTLIKTSPSSKESEYTGAKSWAEILGKYENNNATVNAKTKSIALIDTIQYAVARLDVCVKTADGGTLQDNNPVVASRTVAVPAGGYPLKAVLVGNQKNVKFDFTPISTSDVYVIYDTIMSPTVASTPGTIAAQPNASSYSAVNSTLVLETGANDDAGSNADDVFVALEFVNAGTDFYGVNNQMIPAGARFYMVGQLKASEATQTGYKVFKQDYTTTARFNIKDLTKAYNTIPDLKAPQLEIGMSVDLSWEAGHTYDIDL